MNLLKTTCLLLGIGLPLLSQAELVSNSASPALRLQEGLEANVFAKNGQVQHPSAFSIDEKGHFYVVETWRAGGQGNYGNRTHRYWLLDDNANQTNDDRMNMLKKWQEKEDYTRHDKFSEKVKLLKDNNNDGVADSAEIFADGFNHPLDGIASGIYAGLGKIYFSCIPNIWDLSQVDTNGKFAKRKVLHEGFGVHYSFWGHDLNGFKLSPDGRLYFTIGDRGFNVSSKEGKNLKDVSSGAVFRMEPDGSKLELFYHNLRNPKELAIDKYGHIFTGDNNGDMGDKARLVYCLEQGSSGWHSGLQFMHTFYDSVYPGDKIGRFKAWNDDKMWHPSDQKRAHHLPPLANISNGPSGFTYNPGTGLDSSYLNHFFLTDYRGGAAQSRTHTFQVEAKGAGFEVKNLRDVLTGLANSDAEFGLDGELYILDYGSGWSNPKSSQIIRLKSSNQDLAEQAATVKKIFAKGIINHSSKELLELLSSPDMRIRTHASIELAKRADLNILNKVLLSQNEIQAMHATWTVAIMARNNKGEAIDKLIEQLGHSNPHVRRIATQSLGDSQYPFNLKQVKALITDPSVSVQGALGIALSKCDSEAYLNLIVKHLTDNDNKDVFLRHAMVMALTGAKPSSLEALHTHSSSAVRLAAVLALAKLQSPFIKKFLKDSDQYILEETIFAIKDESISVALEAVTELINLDSFHSLPSLSIARVLNIINTLGSDKQAIKLIQLAQSKQADENTKITAIDFLLNWEDPRKIDKSDGRYRDLGRRSIGGFRTQLQAYVQNSFSTEKGLIPSLLLELAKTYQFEISEKNLLAVMKNPSIKRETRMAALDIIAKNPANQSALKAVAQGSNPIALRALEYLIKSDVDFAFEQLQKIVHATDAKAVQSALRIIQENPSPQAKALVKTCLERLNQNKFPQAAYLELFELAETYEQAATVQNFRDKQKTAKNLHAFIECLEGGDVKKGQDYFASHPTAQCMRCHKINRRGGDAGPDLSTIASFGKEHILESIIDPNAKVAPGFGVISLTLTDGKSLNGIFMGEDKAQLSIKVGNKLQKIKLDQIRSRQQAISSMPPMAFLLKKHEIRDLTAYLSQLKAARKRKTKGH